MSQELQDVHSAMEEAKADIVGLWALRFLVNKVLSTVLFLFFFLFFVYGNKNHRGPRVLVLHYNAVDIFPIIWVHSILNS